MKKILLLLSKGFEVYEASAFIDVIGWNMVDGDGSTQLFTCGLQKEIKSTFNLKVTTDFIVDEIDVKQFDALAIPGGFEEYGFYEHAYDEKFTKLVQDFEKENKPIASICVGALPLAKSGILKTRKATTYNMMGGKRQQQLKDFGVEVLQQPIVMDKNVITSWNPSTAIHVAFKLLEILTSADNTEKVKEIMGFKGQSS